MGKAEGRQEAHEASGPDRGSTGGLSGTLEDQGLIQGKGDQKRKSAVREYAEAIVIAVILALIIRTFIVQAFKIPSGSMKQTLRVGDHILVNKFLYGIMIPFTDFQFFPIRDPNRLDVIVFKFPKDESKDFIKRVIGLPGDAVEVRDKKVYINGSPLEEDYAIYTQSSVLPSDLQPRDNFGPVTVPTDSYFVMGDNRDQSLDSRFWGFVKRNKIQGKAFIVYWSWDGHETWVRWRRIGRLIS